MSQDLTVDMVGTPNSEGFRVAYRCRECHAGFDFDPNSRAGAMKHVGAERTAQFACPACGANRWWVWIGRHYRTAWWPFGRIAWEWRAKPPTEMVVDPDKLIAWLEADPELRELVRLRVYPTTAAR